MRLLYLSCYPYFHCKLINAPTLTPEDGPVVFVANHYKLFGAISIPFNIPYRVHMWMLHDLVIPEEIYSHLCSWIKSEHPERSDKRVCRRARFYTKRVAYMTRCLEAIPVMKNGDPREMIKTMRITAEIMESGDHILIFPENKGDGFKNDGDISEFLNGYIQVARFYHKQTGKDTTFYPIYIGKKQRTYTFGTPVRYNSENGNEEKERVANAVYGQMRAMADAALKNK